MTRIFVLGMMAPRIVGAFGWRFFWATEQIQGQHVSPEVIVAVKDGKPASPGLWIVSDNVREDVANKVLFLKGSRNFGEPAPKQNPPKPKMKVVKMQTAVIKESRKGKKDRKKQKQAV